jgi:hypothetical protein
VIAASVGRIVDLARRNAAAVAILGLVLSLGGAFYAATRLTVDTDLGHMLPTEVAWRQNEIALDQAFPQNDSLLVIVIDGQTGDLADRAARELADRLRAEPELFRYVRQPDGGPFFDQNGLLFLPVAELEALSEQLIAAQPLIGTLARDPSLRGLFETLAMFVAGAGRDQAAIDRLNPTFSAIGNAVAAVLEGRSEPFSWQQIMTGRAPDPRVRRSTSPHSNPARGRSPKFAGWPARWRSTRRTGFGCASPARWRWTTSSSQRCARARSNRPSCRSSWCARSCSPRCAR